MKISTFGEDGQGGGEAQGAGAWSLASLAAKALIAAARPLAGTLSAGSIAAKALSAAASDLPLQIDSKL